MLALHLDNGTEWLQLGGDLHSFLPIVTSQTPVVSTSDLSLTHALQTIQKVMAAASHNSRVGLYISFATPTIIQQTMTVLNATFKDPLSLPFPILVSANVLTSSKSVSPDLMEAEHFLNLLDNLFPNAIPVLGWSTFYGMDPIWSRIKKESILQEFQTKRIIKVIEQLFQEGREIPQED